MMQGGAFRDEEPVSKRQIGAANLFSVILSGLALASPYAAAAGPAAGQPFTVADSIGMTRLVDPAVDLAAYETPTFKFSSDRQYFAIVTHKGNIQSGDNDYTLVVYASEDVLDFVNRKAGMSPRTAAALPKGRTLAQLSSASNEDAIRQIRWLPDNKTIAFLCQSGTEPSQVCTVDISTRKLRKLTDHHQPVQAFALDAVTGRTLFTSTVTIPKERSAEPSVLIGTKSLGELVTPDADYLSERYQFFVSPAASTNSARSISAPFAAQVPPDIWLSPDGRWAVSLLPVPMRAVPRDWYEAYEPFAAHPIFQQVASQFDPQTMQPRDDLFAQFVLIDLAHASMTPLFDAPSGLWIGGALAVHWLPDGQSVIISNTFLPLNATDPGERERRKRAPSVVELNLKTRAISRIADLPVPKRDVEFDKRFVGSTLAPDGTLTLRWQAGGSSGRGELAPTHYRKRGARWMKLADPARVPASLRSRLVLSIKQDLNTPPEILARDTKTRREAIMTSLNPQLHGRTLGKAEVLNWTDVDGRDWRGGLVYPPDFVQGRRYPLVIQTHGFNADEFLVDGPHGAASAFAAQALANKGLLVLQVPDRLEGIARRAQLEIARKGVESAIDELDAKGLINRRRVGLIGWSATGANVQHLITFSRYEFAAATVADAASLSLTSYIALYGSAAPGMLFLEDMLDAAPWGDGLTTWVANNPVLHLDRVCTPLRIEWYRYAWGVLSWWDSYAILRRFHRPVEFYFFPDAAHRLHKPRERLASQQSNVDWFTFWLKDEEDRDPTKTEQYQRWRALREQQEAAAREASARRRQGTEGDLACTPRE